ncbi:MAG TPA: hypothetical protein DEQ88_04265, partial [Clostridiales bacterium]|nr:hypothetical protein [Clostridiales bacterium]
VIFNVADYKTPYETYKDFYKDIFIKLDGEHNIDFAEMPDLHFSADILNEFMWYNSDNDLKLVFVGLDLGKIQARETYDDYEWGLIVKIMKRFVERYPNNTLEFRDK